MKNVGDKTTAKIISDLVQAKSTVANSEVEKDYALISYHAIYNRWIKTPNSSY